MHHARRQLFPPPPSYHTSHNDFILNNPPTYRSEDEQHLLSQEAPQPQQHQEEQASSKSKHKPPLIRLTSFCFQAMFWKWAASAVVLGISASSISEDGLSGTWLVAMVYNLICGCLNVVAPTPLSPRSKTDAKPSLRSLFVLGISTVLWLAAFIMFLVLDITAKNERIPVQFVLASAYIGGAAFVLSLVQWFLVFKIWRKAFSNSEIAEAYKKTIQMCWESNEEELKIPPLGTEGSLPGQGRNRVLEHIYKSNGYGLLRTVFSIIVVGITGAAITIGKGVFSGVMLGAVAFSLANACLHILLNTSHISPRSKTDPKPHRSTVGLICFSSIIWLAASTSIFTIAITADPLNVGNVDTIPGRKRPISVPLLRTRLRGHGIAAGSVGVVAFLCSVMQLFCVYNIWTGRFTLEEAADAFDKAPRTCCDGRGRKSREEQELTSLAP